uniref:Uncharacterized protein n=1 Tax=Amphimedon queenslandica TaxID=400682 RepID=A0A1X7SL83_AMPQE
SGESTKLCNANHVNFLGPSQCKNNLINYCVLYQLTKSTVIMTLWPATAISNARMKMDRPITKLR